MENTYSGSNGHDQSRDQIFGPSQFNLYKGKSALRLQLSKVTKKYGHGCLFLELAPVKPGQSGPNKQYDWEKSKISSKIGVTDISKLLYAMKTGTEAKMFHEFNGVTKSIDFKPKEGGGYFLGVSQTKDTKSSNISIPIAGEETLALMIMLEAALPLIHNWN